MREKIIKKGAIGITLTWFVAIFIILFIMGGFVLFSGLLAGKRVLPIPGSGKSSIDILSTQNNLETQRKLFYLLEFPLNKDSRNTTLKELIVEWWEYKNPKDKEKIEENVKTLLEKKDETCYFLLVNDTFLYPEISIPQKNIRRLNNSFAEVNLVSNNQLKISLYTIRC